jgi:ATP-binding cassette subfamily G (WHITE) protein 2 (PDR)
MIFFTVTHLIAAEVVTAKKPKGDVLLFRRGHRTTKEIPKDLESASQAAILGHVELSRDISQTAGKIHQQTSIFLWRNICFDIKIKKENRRILDHVDGWVKPGTLTVLMV